MTRYSDIIRSEGMLDLQRAYEINFYERANETCLIFKSLSNMSHLRRVRHYYYKRVQIDFKQLERGIPFHRVIDVITGNIFKGDKLDSLLWAYSHRTHTNRFSKHISYYNPIAFLIIRMYTIWIESIHIIYTLFYKNCLKKYFCTYLFAIKLVCALIQNLIDAAGIVERDETETSVNTKEKFITI
jgi:hypothetical protein